MAFDAWELRLKEQQEHIRRNRIKAVTIKESEEGDEKDFDEYSYKSYCSRYDENGVLVEETSFDPGGEIEWQCVYSYDAAGNLNAETLCCDDGTIQKKFVLSYDERKNLVEKLRYGYNGDLESRYTYNYDENNRMIEEIDYDCVYKCVDSKTVYKYDSAGKLVQEANYDAEANLDTRTDLKYDSAGRIIEEADFVTDDAGDLDTDCVIRYEYDSAGRLIERVSSADDSVFERISYKYDADNRIISETLDNGGYESRYVYKYDERGSLAGKIQYDASNDEPFVFTRYYYEYHADANAPA